MMTWLRQSYNNKNSSIRRRHYWRWIWIQFLLATTISTLLVLSTLKKFSIDIYGTTSPRQTTTITSATATSVSDYDAGLPTRIIRRRRQQQSDNDQQSISSASPLSTTTMTPLAKSLRSSKILLFITTHFSPEHIRYFDCCWPQLMEKSQFLPHVHVLIFSTNMTIIPDRVLDHVGSLFVSNPTYKIEFAPQYEMSRLSKLYKHNPKLQRGANLGMARGFLRGWFDNYNWLIRINPDVLIRNSTWLVQQLLMSLQEQPHNDDIQLSSQGSNGSSSYEDVDVSQRHLSTNSNETTTDGESAQPPPPPTILQGIFHRCSPIRLHSDFFAIRPQVLLDHAEVKAQNSMLQNNMNNSSSSTSPSTISSLSTAHSSIEKKKGKNSISSMSVMLQPWQNETMIQMARRILIAEDDRQEMQFIMNREVEEKHKETGKRKQRRISKFKGIPKTQREFEQMYINKNSTTQHVPDPLLTSTSAFSSLSSISKLPIVLPFTKIYDDNHESTAAYFFAPILLAAAESADAGEEDDTDSYSSNAPTVGVAWIPDAMKSKGHCRIRGTNSSIIHEHDYCLAANNTANKNTTANEGTSSTDSAIPICEGLDGYDVI
jgi:hypothetical protein